MVRPDQSRIRCQTHLLAGSGKLCIKLLHLGGPRLELLPRRLVLALRGRQPLLQLLSQHFFATFIRFTAATPESCPSRPPASRAAPVVTQEHASWWFDHICCRDASFSPSVTANLSCSSCHRTVILQSEASVTRLGTAVRSLSDMIHNICRRHHLDHEHRQLRRVAFCRSRRRLPTATSAYHFH